MLEQLQIQNFQAHSKLRLEFAPGITTIVGPSDTGKSSIIRALRWVATNQPGGEAFIRYGTKGCTVRLTVDGHTVTRRRKRGGDVNTYHLDDDEFKAFGRGVPDTVAEFLNLPEVCWPCQHNAIVDLGVIDDTLRAVGSTFHAARVKLESAEEGLTEAKEEADGLAWVADADKALRGVEAAYGDAYAAAGRAVGLRQYREAATQHRAHLGALRDRADAATALFKRADVALDARRVADSLRYNRQQAANAREKADLPVPNFDPVTAAARRAVTTRNRIKALEKLVAEIQEKETTVCQTQKTLDAARKAIPRSCPTCGQSLPPTSTSN